MGRGISRMSSRKLLSTIRGRCHHAARTDKRRFLGESTAETGIHRKRAILLLAASDVASEKESSLLGRRI